MVDEKNEKQLIEQLEKWKQYCADDATLLSQLAELEQPGYRAELLDGFSGDLSFGTGGLRGLLGPGTNRMNRLTVARATIGFVQFLKQSSNTETLRIAIGYDSRIQSDLFAKTAAQVLEAKGCCVYLYDRLIPTPMLSFAVRHLHCDGGIMVTASHNPAQYNGYKAYNHYGCQLNLEEAAGVTRQIETISMNETVAFLLDCGLLINDKMDTATISLIEKQGSQIKFVPETTVQAYEKLLKEQSTGVDCSDLSVVYTPLHGTGNLPVRRILHEIGVKAIHVVAEQELPDGRFPTCSSPNPEKAEALALGLKLCKKLAMEQPDQAPDLLLATDPDCDRIGIAVRYQQKLSEVDSQDCGSFHGQDAIYGILTGNQVGVLLLDYLCRVRILPENPIALKTIVTTEMAAPVAKAHGVELHNVLTGFKFIGEQIDQMEEEGTEARYVFGFEESYGYLSGTFVRDKDAVSAGMLICEMAAYYKKRHQTLQDRMKELYEAHGYYMDHLIDVNFDGTGAMEKMTSFMDRLRNDSGLPARFLNKEEETVIDYQEDKTGLPASNVLLFRFKDQSQVFVRPSGTEPKLKLYLSARAGTQETASKGVEQLKHGLSSMVEQLLQEIENKQSKGENR